MVQAECLNLYFLFFIFFLNCRFLVSGLMGENICKFKTAWPYRICLFTRARPVLDFKEEKKKIMLINGSVKFVCNNESSKLVDSAQLSCYSARAAYSLEYCIVNYGNLVCDLCDGIMCLSFSAPCSIK